MKVLVVIAHYYKPEEKAKHASLRENMRGAREQALKTTLLRWRSLMGASCIFNHEKRTLQEVPAPAQVDIMVAVHEDNHCLTPKLEQELAVQRVAAQLDSPRMLPFAAHKLFAKHAMHYDWFVYAEDDVALVDSDFFYKAQAFQEAFGPRCLLQPNRFEMNPQAVRIKTFIDGDIHPRFLDYCLRRVPEGPLQLAWRTERGAVTAVRARNPHAGCFVLSARQLALWQEQKHFLDLDCSFISPLESAATLGLMKTFAIYKTAPPHMDYFQVEHLSKAFSCLSLPLEAAAREGQA